jgi:flagellar basal-body rod protein FlgG
MLIAALLASNTGLQAASTFLDTVSNNVANSDTPGFKTVQTSFQDLFYTQLQTGSNTASPVSSQLGAGTVVGSNTGLFTQGALTQTNQPLDVAINGDGFFAVQLPDGSTGYTRAGNFTTDSAGNIVTSDGNLLAVPLTLPQGTTSISISPAGLVSATTANGVVQVGTINLTRFQNPAGLSRVGDTTFVASASSGPPVTGAPGTNGLGTLNQGFLEQSNVDLTSELINLVIAQRTFEFNARAITVANETLAATTALIT